MEHPEKVVRLTLNDRGMPVPDQDPVQVRKGNQKVRWSADFPFEIDIEGYPDVRHEKDGKGAHNCKTGFFADVAKYKYSITANGVTNDPELDILP